MAELKQYVTQACENGNVMISEQVISTIVAHSVTEVEGVVSLVQKPVSDISDIIGKKAWAKGLRIVIGQNDQLYIDCNITVSYGQSVVSVAEAVQKAVTAAVEAAAGVKIAAVNVNVCGIIKQ